MAFETINLGTQPAGTGGDTARSAFEKTNRNFLAAEVLSAAMSQAQFEAIRAQNKERYAASGWVSFGNHESGKQVNECKPGLYTSITTPNTLLIGKAGGVGGSKTDHASVHIDGVVFNLTNQFVLTLPSHPTSTLPERMDMYGVESEKVEISAASPNAYQGGLRGVGAAVNLFTATDQQKKDFFSANANTTYIGTDGKIYQWQLYKVSFAGTTDGVPSPSEQGYSLNSFGDLWLKEGKNLLYFGNVLRLNDGGYHPSFNPLGAAKFVSDTFWYNTAASITSRADCFDPAKLLAGSGSIASGKSGRPEIGGRYYDAIYASGFGGVCRDMRYSAIGVEHADYINNDKKVDNGNYRGFESVMFTVGVFTGVDNGNIGNRLYALSIGKNANVGDKVRGLSSGEQHLLPWECTITAIADDNSIYVDPTVIRANGGAYWVYRYLPFYVGGEFFQKDVIGSPEKIGLTPSLKNGWFGSWVPWFPDGTASPSQKRKVLRPENNYYQVYTGDNGSTWTTSAWAVNAFTNAEYTEGAVPSNLVIIRDYPAFSTQTEPAANSVIYGLVPYNVFASSDYRPENCALLGESLIGKVLKNYTGVSVNNKSLSSCAIDGSSKLTSASNFDGVTHQTLTLGTPANNSPAFKVVSYLANINQQAVPHFAYTELKHNGTNWVDDGKVTIVDNQSTKTDLNGNSVLVGTAKLREPIGWIKNKV
ncbi:hypothetical protein B4P00_20070 [Shewanella xiamenensis]|uniref:hypothetical protein n=1 Tax=Shewanella xiamenensis TaxID=332186 RepID=UPI001C4E2705|nr:hypothetical protein [Shewanella xiamenensis]MBW0298486.1 hypothetical protein [Shewanella xiamenensis]